MAVRRDGSDLRRWNPDGTENVPDPWQTAQFHLLPGEEPVTPVSLYVPKGARFVYQRRCRDSCVYVAGWQLEEWGSYIFLLPDGRIELSNDLGRNALF